MLKVSIFICALAVCVAKIIEFKDCGSVEGVINTIDLDPCDSEPCQLKKNTTYTAHISFTAKANINTAKTYVYGIIGGVPIPFEVPPDACNDMTCPIKTGTTEIYTNSIYCAPEYPQIKLVAKWEVKDEDTKENIFCFLIPLEIVG